MKMKMKMYANIEGKKRSKKKVMVKMEGKGKRKRCGEGRNRRKKKKKMKVEAKRKRYEEEEEEGRKASRKRCYADIPVDVLVDILSRLPARCAWRLRSVCKDWKSQIESPSFADLHFRRGSKEEDEVFIFWARKKFRCETDLYHKTRFYSIDYKHGKAVRVVQEQFLHPNDAKTSSINGLVCYYGSDKEIKVGNPVTRELINLPKPTFFLPNQTNTFSFDIGIGFDSTAKTYKVLAVRGGPTSEVEIFTLGGTRGWKKIQLPSVQLYNLPSKGLYANGCLFWFTSEYFGKWGKKSDMGRALMTFNFAKEKFEFVPLPPDIDIHYHFHWIHEVGGRLCLMEAKRDKEMVRMWTLAPNLGTQVWVDHHTVLPNYDNNITSSVLFPIPSGVMLVKKFTLERYICFYNQQGQVVKSIKVRGIPHRFRPIQLHTESLVSLRTISATNL